MTRQLEVNLDRFVHDLLVESFQTATYEFWMRKADELEAARPARGDHHGQASAADLSARWQQLTEAAQACRNRATLLGFYGLGSDQVDEIDAVLGEEPAA